LVIEFSRVNRYSKVLKNGFTRESTVSKKQNFIVVVGVKEERQKII